MQSNIFQSQITVRAEHLDALNHVNNVVFLQWVQDVAGAHWISKTGGLFEKSYFRVVLDHFIEYKGQAFLNDVLTAKTFIEKNESVRSVRVVEFYKHEKLICRAKTNWCLMDRNRNRPTRVPEKITRLFLNE